MGVGLYLHGTLDSAVDDGHAWFQEVWEWVCEKCPPLAFYALIGENADGEPRIRMQLYPAAPPLEIWLSSTSTLVAMAHTHTAGPGYHIFLCYLLAELSFKFPIVWDALSDEARRDQENPTFFSNDRNQSYDEMLRWLLGNALNTVTVREQGFTDVQWSLEMDHIYTHDGIIATCMGPRDEVWLQSVIADPANGADVFPWWSADFDSDYMLKTALCQMWTDVRWRTPITEQEESQLASVCWLLAEAHGMNADLSYPWHEWLEMLELLSAPEDDLKNMVKARAAATPVPAQRIGYRRNVVNLQLPHGWRVAIPGSCAEELDEERGTWYFSDELRDIEFTAYDPRFNVEGHEPLSIAQIVESIEEAFGDLGAPIDERIDHGVFKRAYFIPSSNNEAPWRAMCVVATPGLLAITHVVAPQDDAEFARNFFASISHSGRSPKFDDPPFTPDKARTYTDMQCRSGLQRLIVQCVDSPDEEPVRA